MNTFEFFCKTLAVWALIEGILIVLFPGIMKRISLRMFPRMAKPLQDTDRKQFQGYGAVELVFGLALGMYFILKTA